MSNPQACLSSWTEKKHQTTAPSWLNHEEQKSPQPCRTKGHSLPATFVPQAEAAPELQPRGLGPSPCRGHKGRGPQRSPEHGKRPLGSPGCWKPLVLCFAQLGTGSAARSKGKCLAWRGWCANWHNTGAHVSSSQGSGGGKIGAWGDWETVSMSGMPHAWCRRSGWLGQGGPEQGVGSRRRGVVRAP